MIVEVCANSLESALNAEMAGADRIELCSELAVGGITPSYGLLKAVRKAVNLPVHVLIRPRGGDFTYSDTEFEIMKTNIALCKEMGMDGIVSGILHSDFSLDVKRTQTLIDLSEGMKFTFHRAFDWVQNPKEIFKQLDGMGVDYVLSSGQENSALKGLPLLAELNAMNTNCIIMPGGGVKADNAISFKDAGFKAIHSTGSRFDTTLKKTPKVSMNSSKYLNNDKVAVSDVEIVREILKAVK